jgi:hypothetical protein
MQLVWCIAAEEQQAAAVTASRMSDLQRALDVMMNGELANKTAAQDEWILEKPEWMLLPKDEWTSEQLKLAASFEAEQQKLDDERDKRRHTLESEAWTLHNRLHHVAECA